MDEAAIRRQLAVIGEVRAVSARLGIEVWLRGGWAMDFYLGRVTRDHEDVDWFAWADDAAALGAALAELGHRTVLGPPPEQQLDLVRDGVELSFAWLARDAAGTVVVAGGPAAGERWVQGMLEGGEGQIGTISCRVISAQAQIEIKRMMPVWVPRFPRRRKDEEDIARLRAALPGSRP
ncbi:MAG TPA: aminoglycoside adenylyltransferase [Candidatus Dormibacteraeota bacterium]|jgi:hypothetical protein|nr:aminoglycoside adenylyltransferase [Candidatus Dormibacteraeota bacterium]